MSPRLVTRVHAAGARRLPGDAVASTPQPAGLVVLPRRSASRWRWPRSSAARSARSCRSSWPTPRRSAGRRPGWPTARPCRRAWSAAYLAVELTKWPSDVRVKTGDSLRLAAGAGPGGRPLGLLLQRLLLRRADDLAVGRVYSADGVLAPPHAALREPLPPHDGRGAPRQLALRRAAHHRLQLYLIRYGVYRFLTEYIRPEPPWLLGLTFYQWLRWRDPRPVTAMAGRPPRWVPQTVAA